MRKKALQVVLDVREPSVIELTVGERVQLDRLTAASHGNVAERHGNLLDAGVATLALDPGLYFFKTLSAANLKVVHGGVNTSASTNDKDPWPDPPSGTTPLPPAKGGDDTPGDVPELTVS